MFTNQSKYQKHEYFMRLALKQAEILLGNTKQNPTVGCVIVKNNNVISAGATSFNGRPHAEKNTISCSKNNLRNSYLYTTLEPCSHFGKTPPCTKLIIKKKIKKVFFSIKDYDYRSYNKAAYTLKNKGVDVKNGILKKEINRFYKSYYKLKRNLLPFVTCKLAVSKDFYTIDKKNKWITNKYSRGRVHLMRSIHDCIITSSRTVNLDNPRLNCRINGLDNRTPSRIILDNKLEIKIKSNIIKESNKYETFIFYNKFDKLKIKILNKLKIRTVKIPLNKKGELDLRNVLNKARKLGFSRIFLEAGIKLTNSFLKENFVDDFKLFISNKNLGKNGNASINNFIKKYLINKNKKTVDVNLSEERLLSYKLK